MYRCLHDHGNIRKCILQGCDDLTLKNMIKSHLVIVLFRRINDFLTFEGKMQSIFDDKGIGKLLTGLTPFCQNSNYDLAAFDNLILSAKHPRSRAASI